MAKILDMPKLSPTMEEGLLTTWHKKEGDSVEVDDLLAEVETDKATMEFRSFDKGVLLKLLVDAGAEVKLGQPVAILGKEGEDIADLLAQAGGGEAKPKKSEAQEEADDEPSDGTEADDEEEEESEDDGDEESDEAEAEADDEEEEEKPKKKKKKAEKKADKKKAKATKAETKDRRASADEPAEESAPPQKGSLLTRTERTAGARKAPSSGSVLASPYVRRLAREQGIDLAGKRGSGPHGRVTPDDLGSLQSAPTPAKAGKSEETALARTPAAQRADRAEHKPLSPMRKTIARRLTESKQTVPHFYLTIDVDVRALSAFRETVNAELARGFKPGDDLNAKPAKVSVNDFLIKACALALVRVPACNATFTPDALVFHQRVDISVAVAVPDGLVTPVVRDADQKSLVAIAAEVRDLAARARSKKLSPDEMSDGTFSISNLGMFGIDSFSAVINPPEGAILAVGQVREVPIVENGQLVAGKQLSLTLSCDHRVVDGAVGAAFLAELRALLEQPLRIVTG